MPATPVTPSKTHTWILVLLVWVLALLIFVAGYMMYRDQSAAPIDLSTDATAPSCDDAVQTALAAKTCDAPTPEKATYADSFMPLTFQYYKGWHISSYTDGGTGTTTVAMDESPISTCSECNGYLKPHGSINISSRKLATGETGKTVFEKMLAELTADTNIAITSQSENATGGIIAWTDNNPCSGVGCAEGDHEVWYSSTDKYLFTATLDDDGSTERSAAWTLFVSTATIK